MLSVSPFEVSFTLFFKGEEWGIHFLGRFGPWAPAMMHVCLESENLLHT
jgi:hypothetical protein